MKRLGVVAVVLGGALALVGLVVLSVSMVQSQQRAEEDAISDFADRGGLAAELLAGSSQLSSARQGADAQVRLAGAPSAAALQAWEGEADAGIPYTALYDDRGRLLAVHPPSAEPAASDLGRAGLRDATEGLTATSGVTPSADGPVIETFVPFPAGDAGLRVLLIAVPTELFSGLATGSLEGAAGTPTGSAYVLDAAGTVIATVGDAARRGDAEALVSDAVQEGRTDGRIGEQHFVVSPVAGTALVVALTAPEDELIADLPSTVPPRLALGGLGIAMLAVFWLGGRAFRDARRLRAARTTAEEASEVAAEANLAKTEFLARMSHELRTPLNAILGFGQLLEMEDLTDDQRDSTAQIVKGGRRLLELINEVLDISRIESGTLHLSLESVPVGAVVSDAVELIRPLADDRGIRLHSDLTPDVAAAHVVADQPRLGQVLLNLLSNAVKYNVEGGTVDVSAVRTGSAVRVGVTDTGPGIPEDKVPLLFTPFERLGAEQTTVEGTGLGLTLSKSLVEAMGGTLEVDTMTGRGTTFWVELQLDSAPSAIEEAGPVRAAAPSAARGKLLYIEDNLSNVRLIERLLTHRPDLELVPAMTGALGIDLARQHTPDLILLDLHLPDLRGDVVLARLRKDPRTASIPVVMLSADATRGQVDRLRAAGAVDYLVKPIDVSAFLSLVGRITGPPDHPST